METIGLFPMTPDTDLRPGMILRNDARLVKANRHRAGSVDELDGSECPPVEHPDLAFAQG